MEPLNIGTVLPLQLENEMRSSYMDYAMSVIVSRALPDVRDGLKPVHRRILYAMQEQGMTPGARYQKCAAIIGEVLKHYHPTATCPSTTAWCAWRRTSRCAILSSMARATSG